MSDSLVIIPTYNEKENVERMIRKVFSLPQMFHILIVDDGSPDGTSVIVEKLMEEFTGKLFIEKRQGKSGLGTAYIHGFKWALSQRDSFGTAKYEYVFEMDCDFSHSPDDLLRLREACLPAGQEGIKGADVAIGSRYIKGGKIKNWPIGRVLMSYFASIYVRMVLWINIRDTTAGFKCYKRKVLERINFDDIKFVGYAFQIEMKYTATKLGFNVVEVPIVFTDRVEGVSKMSKGIFKEAFWGVLQMRFKKIN